MGGHHFQLEYIKKVKKACATYSKISYSAPAVKSNAFQTMVFLRPSLSTTIPQHKEATNAPRGSIDTAVSILK